MSCSRLEDEPLPMRKVTLIFPDVVSIAEFLQHYKVAKSLVDSTEKSLKGIMLEADVIVACKQYGAKVKDVTVLDKSK
jgi:hypothetical protein